MMMTGISIAMGSTTRTFIQTSAIFSMARTRPISRPLGMPVSTAMPKPRRSDWLLIHIASHVSPRCTSSNVLRIVVEAFGMRSESFQLAPTSQRARNTTAGITFRTGPLVSTLVRVVSLTTQRGRSRGTCGP